MLKLSSINVLIHASRPAGWIFGPILFGIGFLQSGYTPKTVSKALLIFLQMLTFSFPLCIIVFGINDVYDYHSDVNNPRKLKAGLEGGVLIPTYHPLVQNAAYLSTALILLIGLSSRTFGNVLATATLLGVGWQYSAPPLRLKEVPLLDSLSNGFIVLSAWCAGYSYRGHGSGAQLNKGLVLAICSSGVHALGAAADYHWDMEAGQTTIATYFSPAIACSFSCLTFVIDWKSDYGHVLSVSSMDLLFVQLDYLVDYVDGTPLTSCTIIMGLIQSYILSSNALAAVLFFVIIAVIWSNQNRSRKPSKRRDANLKVLREQKKNAVKEGVIKPAENPSSSQVKAAQLEGSIPGGIPVTDVEQPTLSSSSASLKKEKKKKGRGSATPVPSDVVPVSGVNSVAGPSRSPPASTDGSNRGNTAEEAWTRVESRNKSSGRNVATSDAGLTTTTSMDDDASSMDGLDKSVAEANKAKPKTLAEKLLPKGRKTEVDDILETSNYPELSRVMRINSSPQQPAAPATGFSWGDYEDADDVRGMDADGEDDGGWDVVVTKSRGKAKHSRPVQADKAVEAKTKKQRQREAKKEADKAGRDEAERQRLETLRKHQREREKVLMEEQFGKKAKKASGGMTAVVDARGNLVWED